MNQRSAGYIVFALGVLIFLKPDLFGLLILEPTFVETYNGYDIYQYPPVQPGLPEPYAVPSLSSQLFNILQDCRNFIDEWIAAHPPPSSVSISFSVTEAVSYAAIEGATITLRNYQTGTVIATEVTDFYGVAVFIGLQASTTYNYTITKTGYLPKSGFYLTKASGTSYPTIRLEMAAPPTEPPTDYRGILIYHDTGTGNYYFVYKAVLFDGFTTLDNAKTYIDALLGVGTTSYGQIIGIGLMAVGILVLRKKR